MSEYFDMIGPEGDERERFKVTHVHLIGKTVTYRPARWYERFWLWLVREKVPTRKLSYERKAKGNDQ